MGGAGVAHLKRQEEFVPMQPANSSFRLPVPVVPGFYILCHRARLRKEREPHKTQMGNAPKSACAMFAALA